MDQISSAQASPEVIINSNFEALADLAVYARKASTTTGLTWGYYATNYIVAAKATGVLSVSTATTNWNDTTNYAKVYQVVTGAATVTSYASYRVGGTGVLG